MSLREEVERMPTAMAVRPRDDRGYPVPWFTSWVDGEPDFRYVDPGRAEEAVRRDCCWVCGRKHRPTGCAFVIGPMCAVNRTSAEPPSHVECAIYSARACPFLARPQMERPSSKCPAKGGTIAAPGIMLERNPGVTLVWVTKRPGYSPHTRLFDIGPPERVIFYARSRKATRAEILHSIETGLPALQALADQDGPEAVAQLARQVDEAMTLLPA